MVLYEIARIFTDQPYLLVLYQCVILIGYYGLLRVSELAGIHAIKAKDVHVAKSEGKILLMLRSSKTHGRGTSPQEIRIKADEKFKAGEGQQFFSPFEITELYAECRGAYDFEQQNFFIFRDGSPLKPQNIRSTLCRALKNLGLNNKLYGTHSLRIGRATDLLKMGIPVAQIKILSRWKSNTVFKYIRQR